jgi:hypothetical protein
MQQNGYIKATMECMTWLNAGIPGAESIQTE